MTEPPADLPVVERDVVRLVVLDARARVLLFHTRDPTCPELGMSWELPGGGIKDGETYLDAAIRELREEAGIITAPGQVGLPRWQRDATYRFRGQRWLQHEQVVIIRLAELDPAVDGSQRVGFENEDHFGFRWWPITEIVGSSERFYPGRLPTLLPVLLAGGQIDEPLEVWS